MDGSTTLCNGHQMKIPFAAEPPGLPDNRLMADQRLRSLGRRLGKDPALCTRLKFRI